MVKECLDDGGIIAYPTDTIYGLGCSILHHNAVEKICAIKKVDPEKAQLSFICADLSDLSAYAKSIDNALYRILKTAINTNSVIENTILKIRPTLIETY